MKRNIHYTYEELMAYKDENTEFNVFDCHEGMLFFAHKNGGLGYAYLVNTETHECFELMDGYGHLSTFTKEDIDFDSVEEFEHTDAAYNLDAHHGIIMHNFCDGVARLTWRIYCDYEYGYAYKEEYGDCIHVFIDKHCKVLVPFRSMSERQIPLLHKRAAKILRERTSE